MITFNTKNKAFFKAISIFYFACYLLEKLSQDREIRFIDFLGLDRNFEILAQKPWSLITYNFIHTGFFHLLFNLIILYIVGNLFLKLFQKRMAITIYVLGIISGGLFFILANKFLFSTEQQQLMLLGASSGIYALIASYIVYQPEKEIGFIKTIKLQKIGSFLLFIEIFNLIISKNYGGFASHLGGAIIGVIYIIQFNNGDFIGRFLNLFKTKKTVVYKSKKTNKNMDVIFEKVQRSGYDSLNPKERNSLHNHS